MATVCDLDQHQYVVASTSVRSGKYTSSTPVRGSVNIDTWWDVHELRVPTTSQHPVPWLSKPTPPPYHPLGLPPATETAASYYCFSTLCFTALHVHSETASFYECATSTTCDELLLRICASNAFTNKLIARGCPSQLAAVSVQLMDHVIECEIVGRSKAV